MIELTGKELVIEYPNSVPNNPKVSVLVQTYQHAPFIKECLGSILAQKTDFNFEILIGEDSSTDGTREICIEYAKANPTIIKLFLHDRKNNIEIGGIKTGRYNLIFNLQHAQGEYSAMCEGDDYWIDEFKLQKQFDLLEENKDCNFCVGEYKIWNENAKEYVENHEKPVKPVIDNKHNLKDYLKNKFSQTSTFFMRNNFSLPQWFLNTFLGDQALVVIVTNNKKIFFCRDILSVYRIGANGLSAKINVRQKFNQYIYFLKVANQYTNRNYQSTIVYRFISSLPMFAKLVLKSIRR